ncbi:unnamed protein product [Ambrosiozyma monospora]|uniref:Unnamed protein product n=1 Tax=Ambrosiozyma monospora TaxID=43982 RepID=A0ACB5U2T3_AMBMO|nr:unnamed protein product [Ambrosiozyma monospora]
MSLQTLNRRLNQRVPIQSLQLPKYIPTLHNNYENQLQLLEILTGIAEFNTYYSLSVVKKVVELLEQYKGTENGDDKNGDGDEEEEILVADELYESLFEWLGCKKLDATEHDVVSYCLIPGSKNHKANIKTEIETETKTNRANDNDKTKDDDDEDKCLLIRETPNLISGLGTTGLRTWEASLYLSQYLLTRLLNDDPTSTSTTTADTGNNNNNKQTQANTRRRQWQIHLAKTTEP